MRGKASGRRIEVGDDVTEEGGDLVVTRHVAGASVPDASLRITMTEAEHREAFTFRPRVEVLA